ncbi:hypothetical protein NHQ30_004590 [Ciborinia camelliae]|nr:hypothetical protein NHQ30_004590 [Ciborinia camelliae]
MAMIHKTAREYPTRTRGGFFVDQNAANHKLSFRCLSCLTYMAIRASFTNGRVLVLYNYAAVSWGYHLANSDQTSQTALVKFLRGPEVLTWIHVIAQSWQLHVLLQTSTYLSFFVPKRRKDDVLEPHSKHLRSELELIDDLAIDFGKLVHKFSRDWDGSLACYRQHPLSIRAIESREAIRHLNRPPSFLSHIYAAGDTETLLFPDCNSWECQFAYFWPPQVVSIQFYDAQANKATAMGKSAEHACYNDGEIARQDDGG